MATDVYKRSDRKKERKDGVGKHNKIEEEKRGAQQWQAENDGNGVRRMS